MQLDTDRSVPAGPLTDPGRRHFFKVSGAGAFALGMAPLPLALAQQAPAPGLKPNQQPAAYIAIAADGTVTIQVNKLDFGQGVHTSMAMIAAEELDADFARVQPMLAPAGPAYVDAASGVQLTGGSGSTARNFVNYRELGARMRAMLVAAAAKRWGVGAEQIQVEAGMLRGPGGRSAGFGEMAAAAMAEPVPEKVALKPPADFKLLGKPQGRKNARAISRGEQGYGMDFGFDAATKALVPGMKTVLIARPPVFGGKVKSFDAAAVRAVKGVVAAIEVPLFGGARGVAVIADGFWAAQKGRNALAAQWDLGGLERVDSAAQFEAFRKLAQTPGLPVAAQRPVPFDAQRFDAAPKKLIAEYRFPYLAHAPMEPLVATIHVAGEGEQAACRVWVGTQFQTGDWMAVAKVLGLPPQRVRMETLMAGGGFGRRGVVTSEYMLEVAFVAKAWRDSGGRDPLKVMWTREDDIRGGHYRPSNVHRAEIALDASGAVQGWRHTIVTQSINMGTIMEPYLVKGGIDLVTIEGIADSPYALPISLSMHYPKANVPVLWWRSVGHSHNGFVGETLIDELAELAKADPVEYRRRLWAGKHPRLEAALALAVQQSGYGSRRLPQGHAWGVAAHHSFNSAVAYVVEASLRDGQPRLERVTAGVHCNFAVNPLGVQAQVEGSAVWALSSCLPGSAITLKDGLVEQSNFNDYIVARQMQAPTIDVHIVPSNDPPTGIGEPGVPPLAPAFANAIARLTGKRMREMPFALA